MSAIGVNINPIAFLVIQDKNVKLLSVNYTSAIDKLIDYVPDLMERVNNVLNKTIMKQCDEPKEEVKDKEKEKTKTSEKAKPKKNKKIYDVEYDETEDEDEYDFTEKMDD